jgi:hypothetical protein
MQMKSLCLAIVLAGAVSAAPVQASVGGQKFDYQPGLDE